MSYTVKFYVDCFGSEELRQEPRETLADAIAFAGAAAANPHNNWEAAAVWERTPDGQEQYIGEFADGRWN